MNTIINRCIENIGQVKKMVLPGGWTELERSLPDCAAPAWFAYGPDRAGIEICLYYRGRPLLGAAQLLLHSILSAQPTQLKSHQIEGLEELLRDASLIEAFSFLDVRTQDWNGKRVLIVEGRWNELKRDRFWMFVPTDDDCNAVEEIWYEAPVDQYPPFRKVAKESLFSIQWAMGF